MTELPTGLEDLLGVTERQRQLLSSCSEHLHSFISEAQLSDSGLESDIVLAAEHLRSAANCLARITGRGEAGDVEEVLGVVFEKYSHSPRLVIDPKTHKSTDFALVNEEYGIAELKINSNQALHS